MLSRLCLRLASILLGGAAWGQIPASTTPQHMSALNSRIERIDTLMATEMKRRDMVGASLGIVHGDSLVVNRGYGLANVASGEQVTPDTRFYIASMSKMVTATSVLMLVDEGRLSLDDRIGAVLSDLPRAWQAVTVRQLLSHTSGIPGFTDFEDEFPCPTTKKIPDYVMGDVLDEVACLPLAFTPGSDFLYSETNYHLLAMIVATVSSAPFEEVIRRRVLSPLGMVSTDFLKPVGKPDHRAIGYSRQIDGRRNIPDLVPAVEVGLVSTVADLARFHRALRSDQLVTRASREAMWTAAGIGKARYGLGFGLRDIDGRRQIGHTGGGPAAATSLAYFPDHDLTIILLGNAEQAPQSVQTLVDAVADEVLSSR